VRGAPQYCRGYYGVVGGFQQHVKVGTAVGKVTEIYWGPGEIVVLDPPSITTILHYVLVRLILMEPTISFTIIAISLGITDLCFFVSSLR
jgi:hypothetical protein